jgi:UDPglucose 6-dehydrogenase
VPDSKIITMDTFSSELAKLAANAFLAQRVTSINAIAEICEKTSADIDEVASGVGSDPRIGSKFLRASLGFGGSCFRKDVLSLVYIARSLGLNEVADYWHQVVKINERQQRRLVQRLLEGYLGSLKGKKVAVFGYAFKAATGDIRDTPAARVCQRLLDEGTDVCITDPEATNTPAQQTEVRNSLVTGCRSGKLSFARSPYLAANGADIVVIATEWPEYARLSWCDIYSDMKKPATIMDGRNLLSGKKMQDIGFHYLSIGRPDL